MQIKETQNVGKARYVVSYHNPKEPKYHPDGSPQFDIRIFSNKKKKEAFIKSLKANQ